jgi:hypothetical protein
LSHRHHTDRSAPENNSSKNPINRHAWPGARSKLARRHRETAHCYIVRGIDTVLSCPILSVSRPLASRLRPPTRAYKRTTAAQRLPPILNRPHERTRLHHHLTGSRSSTPIHKHHQIPFVVARKHQASSPRGRPHNQFCPAPTGWALSSAVLSSPASRLVRVLCSSTSARGIATWAATLLIRSFAGRTACFRRDGRVRHRIASAIDNNTRSQRCVRLTGVAQ